MRVLLSRLNVFKFFGRVTFKVGIFLGAFIVLLVTVILTGIFHTNKDWEIGIRLFRGPLLIIGFLFLWGVNVHGWRSAGKFSHSFFLLHKN